MADASLPLLSSRSIINTTDDYDDDDVIVGNALDIDGSQAAIQAGLMQMRRHRGGSFCQRIGQSWICCCGSKLARSISCAVFWATVIILFCVAYFILVPTYIQNHIMARAGDVRVLRAIITLGQHPKTDESFFLSSKMLMPPAPGAATILAATGKVRFRGSTSSLATEAVCASKKTSAHFETEAASSCDSGTLSDVVVGTFDMPSFDVKKGDFTEPWLNGTFHVTDLHALRLMLEGVMEARKICWSLDVTVSVKTSYFFLPFHGIKLGLDQYTCGAARFVDAPPQVTSFEVVGAAPGVAHILMNSTVVNPTPLEMSVPALTGFIRVAGVALASASAAPFHMRPGVNNFENIAAYFVQNDANRKTSAAFISRFVMGQPGHATMFGNSSSTDALVFRGMASAIEVNVTMPGSAHPRIVNRAVILWDLKRFLEGYIPLSLSLFNPLQVILQVVHLNFDINYGNVLIATANESFKRSDKERVADREGPPIVVPPLVNSSTPEILARLGRITIKEIESIIEDDILVSVNGTLLVILADGFETRLEYSQDNVPARFAKLFR